MSELRFNDQVAIITGAGGAIGAAYAHYLADRGALVVINDVGIDERGAAAADLVAREITAKGGQAVADRHDVVSEAGLIVNTALDAFGRVDIVINNAGIWDDAKIYDEPPDRFNRTLEIHLLGTINVTRAAWSELAKTKGRLVQTSSASVLGGSRTTAYPIAKGGIFASVNALKLSAEAAGITINGVLPIAFSQMTDKALPDGPQKDVMRQMLPAQVAAFVALLCHKSVPFNGMCFDVMGTHVTRIVYAHNEGAYGSTPEEFARLTPELIDTETLAYCGNAADFTEWKLASLRDRHAQERNHR